MELDVNIDGKYATRYLSNDVHSNIVDFNRRLFKEGMSATESTDRVQEYFRQLYNYSASKSTQAGKAPAYRQIGSMGTRLPASTMETIEQWHKAKGDVKTQRLLQSKLKGMFSEDGSMFENLIPKPGEVMMSKSNYIDLLKSAGHDPIDATKVANEIIEGSRSALTVVHRDPSTHTAASGSKYVRLIDDMLIDKAVGKQNPQLIKEIKDVFLMNYPLFYYLVS